MVPADADQVTPTLGVFLIRAVNCSVSDEVRLAVSGLSLTTTPDLALDVEFDCADEKLGQNRIAAARQRMGE